MSSRYREQSETSNKYIERLENSLEDIRHILNWRASELGKEVGLSKQTIYNLENRSKYHISITQYNSFRNAIEHRINKIEDKEERKYLTYIVSILLDQKESINNPDIKTNIKAIAAAAKGGATKDLLKIMIVNLFAGIQANLETTDIGTKTWYPKLIESMQHHS